MKPIAMLSLFAILAVVPAFAADGRIEDVAIRVRLDAARKEFDETNTRLNQELLDAMKLAESSFREKGDKAQVDRIKSQLERFEKDGVLPSGISTKQYFIHVRTSRRELEETYKEVISDLTKEARDSEADQVLKELHNLRREVVGNRIHSGEELFRGEMIYSRDGKYMFQFRLDGNVVLSRVSDGRILWSTGTHKKNGARLLRMQTTGNLTVRDVRNKVIWNSNTQGNLGAYVNLQSDGNLVILSETGKPVWATGTKQR